MHGSPALHHPDPVGDKSGKAPSKKFRLDFRWRLGLKCFSYCMQKTKGFSRLWLGLEEKTCDGDGIASVCSRCICMAAGTNEKADSTRRSSQAVPHPSTNRALCRLTSEVERDPVHSTRYGRQRKGAREKHLGGARRGQPARKGKKVELCTLHSNRGHCIAFWPSIPTTEGSAQFCLLCCQPEPVPGSSTARMSWLTPGDPCRLPP